MNDQLASFKMTQEESIRASEYFEIKNESWLKIKYKRVFCYTCDKQVIKKSTFSDKNNEEYKTFFP